MTEEFGAAQRQVEEILLGGERRYTRQQVREKAGVPLDRSVMLWRALGFATVGDDDVVFTDSDVEALRVTQELMLAGIIEPEMTTATARMLGQHLSRLAEWQVHLMTDILSANPELVSDERQLGRFVERLVPDLERLQNYTWRRHLAAYAGRALASPGEQLQVRNEVVGFADMVGFTTLTRRANEAELVTMVDRFDAMTAEIVADNHGRIVKMLGDEVLYVADSPQQGAEIALRLLEAAAADPDLPALRAGMAYGRVLNRFGDVYGSVVNIAARLTGVARPGTVMIDRALADELSGVEAYTVRSRRPVSVRGFSRLKCAVLRRSEESKVPTIDLVPDGRPRRKRR